MVRPDPATSIQTWPSLLFPFISLPLMLVSAATDFGQWRTPSTDYQFQLRFDNRLHIVNDPTRSSAVVGIAKAGSNMPKPIDPVSDLLFGWAFRLMVICIQQHLLIDCSFY